MPSQETIATMLDGMIVLVAVYGGYTQMGWIPYLAAKAKDWSPSFSLPFGGGEKKPPSLQDTAEYVKAIRDYFDYYGCPEGAEHATKCGELLSHAMFCGKVKDAAKT